MAGNVAVLRVLMSLYNQTGRGTYWRALSLGKELTARGHQVALLSVSPKRRWGFDTHLVGGVTVVETPDLLPGSLRSGWDPFNVLARTAWLEQHACDLVHAFENRPVALLPALYARRRRDVPLVQDWCDWFGRGGSVEERPNPALRALLRPVETFFEEVPRAWADGITVINSTLHRKALALGVQPERILQLPNGANVSEISPQDRWQARSRLGLPLDATIVGYTGAIFPRDAQLMAKAFDQLHSAKPDTRLLLIGYCNVPVQELVREPSAVLRTGPLSFDQLADYLAACDIGWLPLTNIGANQGRSPLKLNDFMAAGRPVVSTSVGDLGRFFQQYQVGLLAEDDPKALADVSLGLLEDPERIRAMGERARRLAENELSWGRVADRLEAFYQSCIEARPHRQSRG